MKLSSLWIAVVTGLAATLLWDTGLLLPLKLLIVLVHEIMHGLFAIIGGGQLEGIHISPHEAGETLVSGLDSFWGFLFTVSAGYIGSAIIGALLLRRGLAGGGARASLICLALGLGGMSHLFTDQGSLAAYVGMGWAFGILLMILPGERPAGILLVVLGTLFVWYSFYDLFDFTGQVDATDAGILAAFLQERLGSGDPTPATGLAYLISAIWSISIVGLIFLILRPLLPVGSRAPAAEPAEDIPEPPAAFPGEVTPEIADWLLQRGLDSTGQPLLGPETPDMAAQTATGADSAGAGSFQITPPGGFGITPPIFDSPEAMQAGPMADLAAGNAMPPPTADQTGSEKYLLS